MYSDPAWPLSTSAPARALYVHCKSAVQDAFRQLKHGDQPAAATALTLAAHAADLLAAQIREFAVRFRPGSAERLAVDARADRWAAIARAHGRWAVEAGAGATLEVAR